MKCFQLFFPSLHKKKPCIYTFILFYCQETGGEKKHMKKKGENVEKKEEKS